MDYCFHTVDKLSEIMKLCLFNYLLISALLMLHKHGWKTMFYMGHISSVTVQQHYRTCCVCGWVVKSVQCCAAVACGAVYAAVLSILSVSVWLTGVGLVMASQPAVGEMRGDRERCRWRRRGTARESVISFRLFCFWHASAPPYCLSASADDWQRNCSATDRSTSKLCVSLYCMYLNGLRKC